MNRRNGKTARRTRARKENIMQHITLNNGVSMPMLGFGVYQIPDADLCEACVTAALAAGYRHIDTAAAYLNEEAVGKALRKSGLKRDEIFLTTKLWLQDTGYEATRNAFEASLKRLGTSYVDLYLIHQPFGDVYGSWRAMEDLYEEGKIRAVGVSNFPPDRLVDLILHNHIAPAVNQVETHPFCQQKEAMAVMEEYGVRIESWGPFAEGRNNLFQHPDLLAVARKHGKSVAQVVLRWLNQRNVIAIPKTVKPERMAENFAIFDFALDDDDMARIASLDTGKSLFFDHRDPAVVRTLCAIRYDI